MVEVRRATVQSFVEYFISTYMDERKKVNDSLDFEGMNIVGRYGVIMPILNELVKETPFMITGIEMNDSLYDGYADEFVLSVDGDGNIYVEKEYVEDKDIYLNVGGGITFIHNDSNSKFFKNNEETTPIAFEIDEFCECSDCDCERNCTLKESDGSDTTVDVEPNGFTVSCFDDDGYRSFSFYSTHKDLVEDLVEKLSEFLQ